MSDECPNFDDLLTSLPDDGEFVDQEDPREECPRCNLLFDARDWPDCPRCLSAEKQAPVASDYERTPTVPTGVVTNEEIWKGGLR